MTLKKCVARTRHTWDIYRVAKKRMKYGHLEGKVRTGWNMDTWRIE
jgi:hypothetical protein